MTNDEFDRFTWKTSGARFNASARLLQRNRLALYGAASLSLAATLLALSGHHWTNYAASVASAFAVVFSLIEAAADHGVKSERLQQCAVRIRALMYQAKQPEADIAHLYQQYEQAIAECPENHLFMDAWLVEHPKEGFRYSLYSYGLYWAVIFCAMALIVIGLLTQ